jgi:DNA-binding SARP family transcriptional activator
MIELRALGNAEIVTGVTTLTPSQEIVFGAALYLVVERGKRVSRTRLASLLWPSVPEKPRAHRLRQTILQLKKLGIIVLADRSNLQLLHHEARSDVDELSASSASLPTGYDSLECLPGYSPRFSEPFRDWVDLKREEVHAGLTRILLHNLENARLQGDWIAVENISSQCRMLDPLNEIAVLAQAEAAAMRGGKRKAVSILDRYISEVGSSEPQLKLPANLLRRRVERIPDDPPHLNADLPFIGRSLEMKALAERLQSAQVGKGSALLIVGDAGIGKSRLCAEFAKFAELQGFQVQRANCRRNDVDRPLSVFVDIVPQLRELPGALGCAPETFALLKRLTEFEPRSPDTSRAVDPETLFQNVRAALFDLFDSVAEEGCSLILVEDVQWLDTVSTKILLSMVEWATTRRLFFLLNSRPGNTPLFQDADKSSLGLMELRPLSQGVSTAFLRSALRPGDEPESGFVNWCLSVAEGNPFFLQELANQWIETGHRHEVPPSVTKVLQERLSRLGTGAIQVLQTCSILGELATLERVERVLQYPPHQFLSAVEELSKAAMIGLQREGPDTVDGQLQPRHDLLASAAITRLAPISLAFLHRRSAEVLERETAPEAMPTSLLWACANHRHKAGDREQALSLSLSCAEHLLEVGLAQDSSIAFQKSLDYCVTDEQRLRALPRLAFAFQMNGEWGRSKEALRTCIRLSARLDPTISTHNELELLLLEAENQSSLEYQTLLQNLIPCVECNEASALHRIRAAAMALKIATDIGPAGIMDTLYRHVEPLLENIDVPEKDRLEVEMVYRSVRGLDPLPVTFLRRFTASSRKVDGQLGYLAALLTAASACRFSAHYREGLEFVSQAIDHVRSHKLINRLPLAYLGAVRLHIAGGAFDAADAALAEAEKYPIPSDDTLSRAERFFFAARIAIETNDFSRASAAFARIESVPPNYSASRRAYLFALGIHIGLKQGSNSDAMQSLVANLQEALAPIQGIGLNDFEEYALYLGRSALGQEDHGARMLREYVLHHRRSRWPLAEQLKAVLPSSDLASQELGGKTPSPSEPATIVHS